MIERTTREELLLYQIEDKLKDLESTIFLNTCMIMFTIGVVSFIIIGEIG